MGDRLARTRLSIAAISALCLLFAARTVHAQNAEAEALFAEGEKLIKDGKIAQACEAFDASNRVEARAGTLIRIGGCREQNHQLASAWSAYKDALTRAKDPKKQAFATAKVTELEPKLSYLTLSVPVVSRVEGLTVTRNGKPFESILWNRALPVDGGEFSFGVSAPGHQVWKTTVTVSVESGKITVDVPTLEPTGREVTPPPPPPGEREEGPPPPSTMTAKRKIAIGAAVVGALSIGAGVVLGTQAKGKQSDAHALCSNVVMPCVDADRANDLIKAGQSRALGANIAFGIGAAAVIVAGVLWFTGAPETPARDVSVVPTVAPGETGIAILGRF